MRFVIAMTLFALASGLAMDGSIAAESLKPDMEKCKTTFVGGKPDGSTHEGGFKKFKIDATADFPTSSNATLRTEIDMASLFADKPKLEGPPKNPDFFDVRKYPHAVFETTKIEANETEAELIGKLEMLDKTEEVRIPAKIQHTDQLAKLSVRFKLDRTRWDMNYGVEGKKIQQGRRARC